MLFDFSVTGPKHCSLSFSDVATCFDGVVKNIKLMLIYEITEKLYFEVEKLFQETMYFEVENLCTNQRYDFYFCNCNLLFSRIPEKYIIKYLLLPLLNNYISWKH